MMRNLLILVALFSILRLSPAYSQGLSVRLQKLSASEAGQSIGISVLGLDSSDELGAVSSRTALKPASVMKIVTSAAALQNLGPDYRFSTEVLYDHFTSGRIETLFLRGNGDPSLTLEALWLLVRKLHKLGIRSIDRVVLDDSRFLSQRQRVGQRAYETGSGALALSFNSLALDVCPSEPGKPALVMPDPWEADVEIKGTVLSLAKGYGQFSIDEVPNVDSRLVYRVSGTMGASRNCESFYRSVSDPLGYLGTVFAKFAAELGIKIAHQPKPGKTPVAAVPLVTHHSKPLSLILEDMNHFSTNFIAEQVLYALGESDQGFDRQIGLQKLRAAVTELSIPEAEFKFFDGSGLSHENALSASAIAQVIRARALDQKTGVEFQKSLSVSGRNGTLKDRSFDNGILVRGKTGTLDGVSSLAGLVTARSGRVVVFAIVQNGSQSKGHASAFEEKVVAEIYRSL